MLVAARKPVKTSSHSENRDDATLHAWRAWGLAAASIAFPGAGFSTFNRAILLRLLLMTAIPLLMVPPVVAQSAETARDEEIRASLQQVASAIDAISTHAAEPVEVRRLLYDGAIAGALSRLDPFSVFLDEQQFLALRQQQRGVRQGFGAVLNVQAGKITVLHAVADSPFARAGLGPGDRIVAINGQRIAQMGLEEMVELLQSARNGKVRLAVLQSGSVVPRDFELDPAEVASPTVDKKFLIAPGIGYVHVAHIEKSTPTEIKEAINRMASEPLNGLLLDLRGNPGGSVDAAAETVGLFLPEGGSSEADQPDRHLVVSLRGRNVPETRYSTPTSGSSGSPNPAAFPRLPLVVLINENSASASEIIAAALQEHDRAWLVGETTFGKGVAEAIMPLSQGAALVLTTARYFTPRGRSVQKALPATALAGILSGGRDGLSLGLSQGLPPGITTDNGRPLRQGGGLEPDEVVPQLRLRPLMAVLEESTAFINFAQALLQRRGQVGREFTATDEVVGQFEMFLLEAGFRAPEDEWEKVRPWVRWRIQSEVLTLVYGIEAGEQVEAANDPQAQAAVAAMNQAQRLVEIKQDGK